LSLRNTFAAFEALKYRGLSGAKGKMYPHLTRCINVNRTANIVKASDTIELFIQSCTFSDSKADEVVAASPPPSEEQGDSERTKTDLISDDAKALAELLHASEGEAQEA
jgi:hypothetical protein